MSEQLSEMPKWKSDLFAYFSEGSEEYASRNLIPTNNLHLYIVDNPEPQFAPGFDIPNPYDYRQQPFGSMIERLHAEQPELWEAAKQTAAKSTELGSSYWAKLQQVGPGSDEARAIGEEMDAAMWHKAEVYTRVIETLAPWLVEGGIDPLDLCK